MAALGFAPDDFARAGTPLALAELNIQFKAPLRTQDRFDVTVAVQKVGGARLVMKQRILLTFGSGSSTTDKVRRLDDSNAVPVTMMCGGPRGALIWLVGLQLPAWTRCHCHASVVLQQSGPNICYI